jgi:hypothetical protein
MQIFFVEKEKTNLKRKTAKRVYFIQAAVDTLCILYMYWTFVIGGTQKNSD